MSAPTAAIPPTRPPKSLEVVAEQVEQGFKPERRQRVRPDRIALADRSTSAVAASVENGRFADGFRRGTGARSGSGVGSTASGIGGKAASPKLLPTDNRRNQAGYCGLGGTGLSCPIGIAAAG